MLYVYEDNRFAVESPHKNYNFNSTGYEFFLLYVLPYSRRRIPTRLRINRWCFIHIYMAFCDYVGLYSVTNLGYFLDALTKVCFVLSSFTVDLYFYPWPFYNLQKKLVAPNTIPR